MNTHHQNRKAISLLCTLTVEQPWATLIMTGQQTVVCMPQELEQPLTNVVLCSYHKAKEYFPFPGLVYGKTLALIDLVGSDPFTSIHQHAAHKVSMSSRPSFAWHIENARPIDPFEAKTKPGLRPISAELSITLRDETLTAHEITSVADYKEVFANCMFIGKSPIAVSEDEIIKDMIEGNFFD